MSRAAAVVAATQPIEVVAGRGPVPVQQSGERFLQRSDLAFVFHTCALVFYVRTWMWHTTEAAVGLPGAHGFGWFFRYLTFWSYTLQTEGKRKQRFEALADTLSCAAFSMANTVTAMFYAIESSTKGLVEGGAVNRPDWLNAAVHSVNSAVAWGDLLVVEERSFGGSSRHLAITLALAYSVWALVVRRYYGKFAYPILNRLPFPAGFLGFVVAGMSAVLAAFELGRIVKHTLLAAPAARARRRAAGSTRAKGE